MFFRLFGMFLCAQMALAQLPAGVNEQQLYQAVLPLDQYAQGYGTGSGGGGGVERIDNQPVELPVQEETRQGQDQIQDHQLQDERREGRVDSTKEIHNYQIQKRIVRITNRILHRYLKNLLVNTVYNTNIQRVNHQKLINLLLTSLQETHQPKLLVKYARQDTTNDLGERQEQAEISEDRQDKVLTPVFIPATVEKIGYDGLGLGVAVSAGSTGGFSSGGGGFSNTGSSLGRFSSGSSSSGLSATGSSGRYSGFSSSSLGSGQSGRYTGSSGLSSGSFSRGSGSSSSSSSSSSGSRGSFGGVSSGLTSGSGSGGFSSSGSSSGGSSSSIGSRSTVAQGALTGGDLAAVDSLSTADLSALVSSLVSGGGAGSAGSTRK